MHYIMAALSLPTQNNRYENREYMYTMTRWGNVMAHIEGQGDPEEKRVSERKR